MAKRGHGEGSIVKRSDGRWQASLLLSNGTRKTLYAKSQKEAVNKLAQLRRDVADGLMITTSEQTMHDFLLMWLETVRKKLEPGGYISYEKHVRVHLIPGLGKIPVAKLTAAQVQAFYNEKRKTLSETTVSHIHATLRAALNMAVRLGMVVRNVATLTDAPKSVNKEYMTLTLEQSQQFLASVEDDRLAAMYVLALTTGMREGEILGLQWDDIQWSQRQIIVRHTLHRLKGAYELRRRIKSLKGRRTILLTRVAFEALQRHRQAQEKERCKLGDAWQSQWNLVFCNPIGEPLHYTHILRYELRKRLAQAGLPEVRFHDLRHTGATLLMEAGVHPKVVSEMLGHSDIRITLMIYSHITPRMMQTAVRAMDTMFASTPPDQLEHGEIEMLQAEIAQLREQNVLLSRLLSTYQKADHSKEEKGE
jgi:integrase